LESSEQLETCIIPDTESTVAEGGDILEEETDESRRQVTYAIDENQQYVECYETRDVSQHEIYDESSNDIAGTEDYYEEEEEVVVVNTAEAEEQLISELEDVVTFQNNPPTQWIKTENIQGNKKRKISMEDTEEPQVKIRLQSPAPSTSSSSRQQSSTNTTEHSAHEAFGRTIGEMLLKYPLHLRPGVMLEVFQAFNNFDSRHKLTLNQANF
jgi:hypothetical protein